MLRRIVLQWLIIAVAVGLTAAAVPSVHISGGLLGLVVVSAVFGLVNAILGPVLRLLTLPLTMMTFGLFAIVVNGILLALTAGLSDDLDVGGPLATIVGALLISLLSWILHLFIPARRRRAH